MKNQLTWPELLSFRASDADREARRRFIGGSDANIIFSGDAARVRQLWLEKRGEAEPEDLSDKLQVMLGCWSEPFNRLWYEKLTGQPVTKIGQTMVCSKRHWRCCTLDGFVDATSAIFEAKHTSAFSTPEQVLERYMPQLQHNMAVTGVSRAILSVIFGNHKYEIIEVASDWLYQLELLDAEQAFWNCVVSGEEPVPAEVPPAPRPVGSREVCFEGNNAWASAAVDWVEHRDAAKKHAAAAGLIKSLIEDDVTRAFGHGVEAKRSKSGALILRELA
jgi:predicted phage-related endonuclease